MSYFYRVRTSRREIIKILFARNIIVSPHVKPEGKIYETVEQNFDNTFAEISECNLITMSVTMLRGRITITRDVIPGLKSFLLQGILFSDVFLLCAICRSARDIIFCRFRSQGRRQEL